MDPRSDFITSHSTEDHLDKADTPPKIFLSMAMSHLRYPLDTAFTSQGGSLGAAGARGATTIMLTGSDHSIEGYYTDKPKEMKAEIPSTQWKWIDGKVNLSNRMHLLLCAETNSTVGVNGVLGDSISGEGIIRVATLFDRVVEGKKVLATGICVTKYGTFSNGEHAFGFRDVQIVDDEGNVFTPHFYNDASLNTRMKRSESVLQKLYDDAARVKSSAPTAYLSKLSKPVSAAPFGLNGSGYIPSFAMASREYPFSVETLEDVLKAAVATELVHDDDRVSQYCSTENGMDAELFAGTAATALSLATCNEMIYRSDGVITAVSSTESKFIEHELWTNHSSRNVFRQDDCEGAASKIVGTAAAIMTKASGLDRESFPFTTATARALVHYAPAMSVLTANSAEASGTHTGSSNVAGHCTAVFVEKSEMVRALYDASTSALHDKSGERRMVYAPVADDTGHDQLADSRLRALYPYHEQSMLSSTERTALDEGWKAFHHLKSQTSTRATFMVSEGTAPVSSRIYTSDRDEREGRATYYDKIKQALTHAQPSVARQLTWLDSLKDSDGHRFYKEFNTLIFPETNGLYTNAHSNEYGCASPHYLLTPLPEKDTITASGRTPKDIATNNFAAIPLYTVDRTLMDEAMFENKMNTLRPSKGPKMLDSLQTRNLATTTSICMELREQLETRVRDGRDLIDATYIVPFAAMANNPSGVRLFAETLQNTEGLSGEVHVHRIRNLVGDATGTDDAGTFVSIHVSLPSAVSAH